MLSFLEFWDRSVEKLTLKRINEEHKRKLSLKSGVFNFSSFQIPSKDAHTLMNSKNTVFKLKIPLKRLKSRIRTESINYAQKFRKYVERNNKHITSDPTNFKSWLMEAANSSTSKDFKIFYLRLLKNINTELKQLKPKENLYPPERHLIQRLNYPGLSGLSATKTWAIPSYP